MGAAFTLTLLAGLATGLGGLIAFLADKTNARFLATSLGFSAGVMIYVSFVEILPKAHEHLTADMGERPGAWAMLTGFFGGITVIAVIDRLVPAHANPHEFTHDPQDIPAPTRGLAAPPRDLKDPTGSSPEPGRTRAPAHVQVGRDSPGRDHALLRMGLLTAVAVAIHNFPEGFATFMTALADPSLAIPITVAIALHNVPEGIAVAVPVYQATGSKAKSLGLAFASGLVEPMGAVAGYVLLRPFLTDTLFGVVFAAVAGIMVFISLDKLLPTSERYGGHHLAIYGVIAGMGVMAISLVMLL